MKILKQGSKGVDVVTLQRALNVYGYGLALDGEFGPLTEKALKSFQERNGLYPDGIAGPLTYAKLKSLIDGFGDFYSPPKKAEKYSKYSFYEAIILQDCPIRIAVLKFAETALGREEEKGNRGPIVRASMEGYEGGEEGSPWCAGFVTKCVEFVYKCRNQHAPIPRTFYVPYLARNAQARGIYTEDLSKVKKGHIFMTEGYKHVGFVKSVDRDAKNITTVEGNAGDKVASQVRDATKLSFITYS